MSTTHHLTILASSIAAALACPWVIAEEAPATVVLPTVTISAAAPRTFSPDRADANAASDSASLLRNLPGVSMYGAGGVSSMPVIRGLGDDRIRTQVDGMDLVSACANHMNPALSYIAPAQVESIQLLSGITPVSAGGDSIGGTIRVKSATPEFAAAGQPRLLKGSAGTFYRSNGDAWGANASAAMATDTLAVQYTGSTARAGNYQAGGDFKPASMPTGVAHAIPADEVGSSRYRSDNHSLAVAMRNDLHLVELRLGSQDIPYQGFPNQRMDMTGNVSEQANLRYQGRFDWGLLEARLYREHTRHTMNFGPDKQYWYGKAANIPGMPMDTEGRNTGAALKGEWRLAEAGVVRLGGEYQRYRLDDWWAPSGGMMAPDTFVNINGGRRDRSALYAEWDARWSQRWFTQLGMRGESVAMDAGEVHGYNAQYAADAAAFNARSRRRSDNNLDVAALARYAPDAGATYALGYARKTRSPNLYERYTWSTGGMAMNMVNMTGDGNGHVGNAGLLPETAHTFSASAEWQSADEASWRVSVTPFHTRVNDYVDARCLRTRCDRGGFVYLRFVNQDARLYGAEMSGELLLLPAVAGRSGSVTASAVVNYVNGRSRVTGDGLYNMMPLNATLALTHRAGAWDSTAEVQLVGAKDDVSLVRNEIATAGYGLLNLRTSYRWREWQFDAGIDNALDRNYALPLGGAYLGQGSTMAQSGVRYGIQVPGAGRSLNAGVSMKF